MTPFVRGLSAASLAAIALGCGGEPIIQKVEEPKPESTVVVYTALDEMYSLPVLEAFEKKTGINVEAVPDTEAAKTTGLRTRLVAEKDRPRADVFWNNEVAQTVMLKEEGILEPYVPEEAPVVDPQYMDADGYWTGFAARGRVIIYNTDLVSEPPKSIQDFLKPEWKGKVAIANPLFGTTATHAAALFALWGADPAKEFFRKLKANDVAILEGNATVRDRVAAGDFAFGLTDTDDANGAVLDKRPVKWLFPDQGEEEIGTLVIPNTVALIKGAPHPTAAKQLIAYLLTPEVELTLAKSRSIQIPLRIQDTAALPGGIPEIGNIKQMGVTYEAIGGRMKETAEFIAQEFL